MIHIEDRDGAKFNHPIPVQADRWQRVVLASSDFRLSKDSPVRKRALDNSRLGSVLVLADLGGILGNPGDNLLRFKNFSVIRHELPVVRLPSIVNTTVEIHRSGICFDNIHIGNGGRLSITSPRFVIAGDVMLEGGRLDVSGTALSLQSRFNHDRKIACRKSSVVSFDRCTYFSSNMGNLNLWGNSRLSMRNTDFFGAGFTVGVPRGCSVHLDHVKCPGEFIVMPGAQMRVDSCEAVLLWCWFNNENPASMNFPGGSSVTRWLMPARAKIDLSVESSRDISWGLVIEEGADVHIKDSAIRAAGLSLTQPMKKRLAGIKNKVPVATANLNFGDRKIKLNNTTVEAWNIYPRAQASVAIEDCVCGEVMTFDNAKATMKRSVCDGTGGYIAAKGNSQLTITGCTLDCPVVAIEQAQLTLNNCRITGDLSASGESTVRLKNTVVTGQVKQLEQAKIYR